MGKKLTTREFIERSRQVHGDRYDYSASVYTTAADKVRINCGIHGMFEQNAMDHMKGRGCSKCNERQVLTADTFIDRANERHGYRYDYSLVQYKNVTTKVIIKCPEHGAFEQTPKDHMHKYGCPTCGGTKPITTTDFVRRAVAVHGNKYTYGNVELVNMNTNVDINCVIHGSFSQRPADHLNGTGCPVCGTLKQGGYTESYFVDRPGSKDIPAQLYLITVDDKFCKIGITTKRHIKQRFPGIRFNVVETVPAPLYEAYCKEQAILTKYYDARFKVKDMKLLGDTGWTECFPLTMLEELKREFFSMEQ